MNSSPACRIGTRPHSVVNFEVGQQRRSSSSRLARAHERAGRGRARRASKRGHSGHTMPSVLLCVRCGRSSPVGYHVIAGEGNAGNSLKLSGGHSASFGSSRPRQTLCEIAKAQQFTYCIFRQRREHCQKIANAADRSPEKTCSMSGDRLAMLHERGQAHRRSMRPRLKSFWLP